MAAPTLTDLQADLQAVADATTAHGTQVTALNTANAAVATVQTQATTAAAAEATAKQAETDAVTKMKADLDAYIAAAG